MAHERFRHEDRIVVDREILAGKPVVKGTRIAVELVLAHLAENPDLDELFAAYPHLAREDVQACLGYAGAVIQGEDIRPTTPPNATHA